MRTYLAFFGAVAIVGCGAGTTSNYKPKPQQHIEPATVAVGEEHRLLPLKAGNTWTYAYEFEAAVGGTRVGGSKFDIVYRVVSSKPQGDGIAATLQMARDGQPLDTQEWLSTPKGMFQLSLGDKNKTPFSTPQPVWLLPFEQNQEFEWRGTGMCPDGKPGNLKITTRRLPPQEVDSEVKRYSAIPFESRTEFSGGGRPQKGFSQSTTWFVPDVGIVRFKQDLQVGDRRSSSLLKLKAASVQ